MSDNWLIFVPEDPEWRPSGGVGQAVTLVGKAFPRAEEIEAKTHDAIQFIDQGQNFEDVRCPICEQSLMGCFGDLMKECFDEEAGGFTNLEILAPCCGKLVCLNDLQFETPAAFGSFQIDVMNPDIGDVPADLVNALQRELGTSLRTFWCHI